MPPLFSLFPEAPSDTISGSNMETSLNRQKERISEALSCLGKRGENTNCPFKLVRSYGGKVRGNGHLKSHPGCGLH